MRVPQTVPPAEQPTPRWRVGILSLIVSTGWLVGSASASRAEPRWMQRPATELLRRTEPNEAGFTLGELFDRKLWGVVRHPLTPASLDHVEKDVHRPPPRGVQFELLTPGDIGATIHFRW